ncbi:MULTISPECIES: elongation factor P 5-aminopentanone reductase [unclassified Ruminococcus]|uniref:elongation factor P 5-aminopentanone reductase n=1 Tax=unclassified Ruminococcus TaxID=2608920 RepID=UPI002109FE8C|nr:MULTISPECIES: 3-oxoacyl-ACP reductase FabG [unclassified Ruminococcus]MCQ4023007.1 SDR family oxidoreductase [Ruminococcus sp. zg-924]MCQ4115444.1 SDR family oxidoreductase [Ruminococcus sp. zg-921]
MAKSALITGGSRGIGAAIAVSLAKEGYDIAVTYKERSDSAENVIQQARQFGVKATAFKADVKSFARAHEIADAAIKEFGQIDVLVNNAGIASSSLFTDLSFDEWNEIIGTNLTGCYNFCHAVLPHMIRRHSGSIINISSMWGQVGASCEVAYSASKAGIIGLTKALAKEVGLSGIRVNAIAPGVISTEMLDEYTKDDLNALKDDTPLNRLGTPQDIADAAVFLSGEKSSFITGQIIGVNGGFVI